MNMTYRKYVAYRSALANALENASTCFVSKPVLTEYEFESVMASLPPDKRAHWEAKFQAGYELTATQQQTLIVDVLSYSTRPAIRAA